MVERILAKVEVASSRLVSRSRSSLVVASKRATRKRKREVSTSLFFRRPNRAEHARSVAAMVRFRRRGSKAAMQRTANPSRWVRLPPAPPDFSRRIPRRLAGVLAAVTVATALGGCGVIALPCRVASAGLKAIPVVGHVAAVPTDVCAKVIDP